MKATKKNQKESDGSSQGGRMARVLRDTALRVALLLLSNPLVFSTPARAASLEQAKREYFDTLFKNPSASVEQRKSAFEKLRSEGVAPDLQQKQQKLVESRISKKKARQRASSFSIGSEVKSSQDAGTPSGQKGSGRPSRRRSAPSDFGSSGSGVDTSTMPDVLDFTTRPSASPAPSPSE